jgi:hypothetical protein
LIGAAYKMKNKSQRQGIYKCKGCEEQFTGTVGTVIVYRDLYLPTKVGDNDEKAPQKQPAEKYASGNFEDHNRDDNTAEPDSHPAPPSAILGGGSECHGFQRG